MAFNQNGGLPVSTVAAISDGLLTAAKAPNIFAMDTTGRELTAIITSNGGNLPSGSVISFSTAAARTVYLYFYGTSDTLVDTQTTASGALTYTTSAIIKKIWARADASCDLEVAIKPAKGTPTQKLDIIRSSKTYTQGTDYTTGEYAHIIGWGAGGGGGAQYTGQLYGSGAAAPGGNGAVNKTTSVQLSGNYSLTIGTGGTGGQGGGALNSPAAVNPPTPGNAGGSTTGFNLNMSGGNGGIGGSGYTPGTPGNSASPTSVADGYIFSTTNVAPGSGYDPSGPIGSGGPGKGGYSRNVGRQTGDTGSNGGFAVLRYTP